MTTNVGFNGYIHLFVFPPDASKAARSYCVPDLFSMSAEAGIIAAGFQNAHVLHSGSLIKNAYHRLGAHEGIRITAQPNIMQNQNSK
jgi:hypothetical protein